MKVPVWIGLFFLGIGLLSCNPTQYKEGYFPEEVRPLAAANSPANDYNSDLKIIFHEIYLSFSSDRFTSGEHFDLFTPQFAFSFDQEDGQFFVNEYSPSFRPEISDRKNWFDRSRSDHNELGPHAFLTEKGEEALLFSRDEAGFYSIHYLSKRDDNPGNFGQGTPYRILDQSSNEMYPSFLDQSYLQSDWDRKVRPEQLVFSSDRDGNFDIYQVDLAASVSILSFLRDGMTKIGKKLTLNSPANDHAPFVFGNVMVFASDRAGGYGGYDLYYSRYEEGDWSAPQNFGPKINSPADEFRPVLSDHPQYENRLMIFSSNRPGGLGGFDLYFVGVPRF